MSHRIVIIKHNSFGWAQAHIKIRRQTNMAKVELKKPIVDEISEALNGAKAAVLVDYRGLTVEEDTALRKQLREAGVVYKVYKNTMLNFAVKGTEFEELSKHLEGPTAIAISKEDATAPARILYNFSKNAQALELKAGVVDGTYYDEKGIAVLQQFHQEKSFFQNSLALYSHLLQTSLVLLSRLQRRMHNFEKTTK